MQYFHFDRLINKYSSEFSAILPESGHYADNGEYVIDEKSNLALSGAIIDISESKVRNSNGTLTLKDKQLFIKGKPIEGLINSKVVYGGNQYSVESETENHSFTGFSSYTLKYISAFNGA